MRRLLSFLVCLTPLTALAPAAGAQVIQGVVLDADAEPSARGVEARTPVVGADVALLPGPRGREARTMTDSLGRFTLPVPGPGTYGFRVRHPSYVPYDAENVEVGAEETVVVVVRLGRNVIPLDPLIVTARVRSDATGFEGRRAGGGFGTFLTREEIEARAAGRTTDLLRGLPGVTVRFVRWGVGPAIEMRDGFGRCEPAIYVDGILAPQTQGSRVDDFLTPDRIEGVEVYTSFSTAPVQYIMGTCGVILFWTRRGERGEGEPWHWKRVIIGLGAAVALILWFK